MSSTPDPAPQYEPGGGKLIAVVVILVVAALAGMAWSFFSRQNALNGAVPPEPTFSAPAQK